MLTEREMTIINMTANGQTAKEIARIMCRAESTIQHHLGNIRMKLNARNTTHAVLIYFGKQQRAA